MYFAMSRLSSLDVRWAGLVDANHPEFMKNHHNPHYELIVVADGNIRLQMKDELLTLQSGDVLLLTPWEQHRGCKPHERSGRFFWVQFTCEPGLTPLGSDHAPHLNIIQASRSELYTIGRSHDEQLILPRRHRTSLQYKILSIFEQLVETIKRPRGYYRYFAAIQLSEMLWQIATEVLDHSEKDTLFPVSYLTFRGLLSHINNYFESELDREQLERVTDRKYEYLCQIFKKYAGMSIFQYVQELRVKRAEHLLVHTKKTVREIAETVGYSDPFYFSRLFKKVTGLPPQAYRAQKATL
ncbi:helix-turn-helix domain-containing protein [Cohnella fermenti]|nr:helix-turn-helix domain-containing protein [Cohnella fermenti]